MRITKEQLVVLRKRYTESKIIRDSNRLERKQVPSVSDLSGLKKQFQGEDVHILGSGPSLYGIDWNFFKDKKTICINNTIKYMTVNPSVHVFLDMPVLQEGGKRHGVPIITKVGNNVPSNVNEVYKIRCGRALTNDPMNRGFYSAFSTGHIAIHLALYFEAKNIYLWGIEKGFLEKNEMIKLSDHMKSSPWYTKDDIIEQDEKLRQKGFQMGHFYSPDMIHRRDNKPKAYHGAGSKLDPFYTFKNIYQMTPIHFTKFPYKDIATL